MTTSSIDSHSRGICALLVAVIVSTLAMHHVLNPSPSPPLGSHTRPTIGRSGTVRVRDVSRARALRLAGDAPRRLARVRASEETKATREETRRRLTEMGYDPNLLEAASGSRWDPTFQRWVRDDRTEYADIIITPKAGSPYIIWPAIFQVLKQKGLESIPTQEVEELLRSKKATVVDVRMKDQYENGHVDGAINVPMFRDSTGSGVWDNIKRVVNAALLIRSTERDPEFSNKVKEAVGNPSSPVILYCGMGGSMETKIQSNKEMYKKTVLTNKSFGRKQVSKGML
ncbi:hypothetical protein AAMO2058_001489700 [Amorphochlora amoebiformis]